MIKHFTINIDKNPSLVFFNIRRVFNIYAVESSLVEHFIIFVL